MCMGSLKKFMNETKPGKSYGGYYLMVENNNLCLLCERQRRDPLKQARAALIKAEHSFKLLVIDTSALGFSWYISLNTYHILVIDTSVFAFQLTSHMWRSFTACFIYLVLAGDMKDSGVHCSLQASHQQCKIIWKYSKGPKLQLELPVKAVEWVCSRLFCALELGSGKGRPPAILAEFTNKLYLQKRWCNPSKTEAAGLPCCCPSCEEHVVSVAASSVPVHPCCSLWLCWGGRTCWWQ